ncbi:MAG: hypothetical protein Q8919_11775, partial [Bacteroidota bacterium]|nr:hypothetical protein [Bacteroidota bacterium]
MKIRIVVFLCIYGAIGIGYADAQSQFVWHLSHTDFDGRQNFCFDAVSCYGKNCTAGGTIIDNATQ